MTLSCQVFYPNAFPSLGVGVSWHCIFAESGQCFARGLYDVSLYLESGHAFWQECYICEVIFLAYHIRRRTK